MAKLLSVAALIAAQAVILVIYWIAFRPEPKAFETKPKVTVEAFKEDSPVVLKAAPKVVVKSATKASCQDGSCSVQTIAPALAPTPTVQYVMPQPTIQYIPYGYDSGACSGYSYAPYSVGGCSGMSAGGCLGGSYSGRPGLFGGRFRVFR